LSHDLHLYSELTALENLVFFGRLYGVANAETVARRRDCSRRGSTTRGGDVVSGFSRGMRQRLALERALAAQPAAPAARRAIHRTRRCIDHGVDSDGCASCERPAASCLSATHDSRRREACFDRPSSSTMDG
jgi:hypothetical protein